LEAVPLPERLTLLQGMLQAGGGVTNILRRMDLQRHPNLTGGRVVC
jgi:hypothetical protein